MGIANIHLLKGEELKKARKALGWPVEESEEEETETKKEKKK